MKRFLYYSMLMCIGTLFTQCAENKPKGTSLPKVVQQQPKRIVAFIQKFSKENPNWAQNDIILEETNKKFEKQLKDSLRKDDFLFDYPLELQSTKKIGNKYFADFMTPFSIDAKIGFNVLGYFPKEYADKLVTNKKYRIKGKFVRFINKDFDNFVNMIYTTTIGLEKDNGLGNGKQYGCGAILMYIEEIK